MSLTGCAINSAQQQQVINIVIAAAIRGSGQSQQRLAKL